MAFPDTTAHASAAADAEFRAAVLLGAADVRPLPAPAPAADTVGPVAPGVYVQFYVGARDAPLVQCGVAVGWTPPGPPSLPGKPSLNRTVDESRR